LPPDAATTAAEPVRGLPLKPPRIQRDRSDEEEYQGKGSTKVPEQQGQALYLTSATDLLDFVA
jgi:hypothetical protein